LVGETGTSGNISTGAFKGNASKVAATVERLLTDAGYAGRYDDARQADAILERRIADACYVGGYGDTRQVGAAVERMIADGGYGVRYADTRQAGATAERLLTDAGYAVGYGDTRQASAAPERIIADGLYTVWYGDARQAGATAERTADAGYTVGNGNARQVRAKSERKVRNWSNGGVRQNNGRYPVQAGKPGGGGTDRAARGKLTVAWPRAAAQVEGYQLAAGGKRGKELRPAVFAVGGGCSHRSQVYRDFKGDGVGGVSGLQSVVGDILRQCYTYGLGASRSR